MKNKTIPIILPGQINKIHNALLDHGEVYVYVLKCEVGYFINICRKGYIPALKYLHYFKIKLKNA